MFLLIYYVGFSILKTISNFFEVSVVRYAILFGIPAVIILMIVCNYRLENTEVKRFYLKYITDSKPNWKSEGMYIWNMPDFRTEGLAFATLLLPLLIAIGFGIPAAWWINLLTGIIIFILLEGSFLILDALFWLLIHMKWRNG